MNTGPPFDKPFAEFILRDEGFEGFGSGRTGYYSARGELVDPYERSNLFPVRGELRPQVESLDRIGLVEPRSLEWQPPELLKVLTIRAAKLSSECDES